MGGGASCDTGGDFCGGGWAMVGAIQKVCGAVRDRGLMVRRRLNLFFAKILRHSRGAVAVFWDT